MKLKYYLRGLGIGILATVLILGISHSRSKPMSDEEVIQRAKELGMVESTYLSQLNQDNLAEDPAEEPSDSEQMNGAEPETPEEPEQPAEPETPEEPEQPAEPETPEEPEQPTEPENPEIPEVPEESEYVIFEIVRGQSSTTICRNLESAGLIEDATAFDRYLSRNGYDKRLQADTFEILKGASEEEIAMIITGQR